MKTLLLSTAAVVMILVALVFVACSGEGTDTKFEVMPSVSFPGVIVPTKSEVVPTATLPAVLPTVRILTPVSFEDPCPRTEVTGSKVLAAGAGFSIDCGTASGLIVAGIQEAKDLVDYRRIKTEADEVLCRMWSQDFINRRISWAPPTPGNLALTSDDVHTVCSEGK